MKIVSTCYYPDFDVWTWPEWAADELQRNFPAFEIVRLTSKERLLTEIQNADIFFAWTVSEEAFRAARKLKWIHTGMAGVNWILIPPVVESDVLVSNSKGVHAVPVAEHTMALILAFSRRLHDCLEYQRKGLWGRTPIHAASPSFEEVLGKTIGILGLGAIGQEIAKRARAFGMRVIGIKKNPAVGHEFADKVVGADKLNDVLPEIDYLVIATPSTPGTRNLIGREQMDRLKPTCFIINIARGEIIDQDALIDNLNSGRIAGAGLDVFTPDPLPDNHPLYFAKNVILTPHASGVSPRLWRRVTDLFVENIRRFLAGRELINQVDKRRGY